MAKKKAKKSLESPAVSFTAEKFEKMVDEFLTENQACDGDWKVKAMEKFLGHTVYTVQLVATLPATVEVRVSAASPADAMRKAEAQAREDIENGEFSCWDYDDNEFTVMDTKIVKG